MKTFTVRELDRAPGKVLASADRYGVARIRRRDGRTYAVRPVAAEKRAATDWGVFAQRQRDWLRRNFAAAAVDKHAVAIVDRMITGDDTLP